MKLLKILTVMVLSQLSLNLAAENRPQIKIDKIDAPVHQPIILDDTQINNEIWNEVFGETWVRNVNQPALYQFTPEKDKQNGKAVLIAPGGGYLFVSIENEGFGVAEKLAKEGYTAFVLKYRTRQTTNANSGFKVELAEVFGSLGKKKLEVFTPAVDDLERAVQMISENRQVYGIEEISVIGFSAGARTAINLIETRQVANRLKGVALIYPPLSHDLAASGPRPPLFFAIATDDPLFKAGDFNFLEKWLAVNPQADMHFYSNGGHGFGISPKGTTSDGWWGNYVRWLQFID